MARTNISAQQTSQPDTQLEYVSRKRLTSKEWAELADSAVQGVEAALADREPLEQNLDEWNELYEMIDDKPDDWPVVGASNIFVPLIPTQLESLVAYIAGQVLVPNPFMVTGLTPEAAKVAPQVERYYNAEFKKQRAEGTWFEQFIDWLHFAVKDGTGYIEVLWKYKKTKKRMNQHNPRMEQDPNSGLPAPVLDDQGKPIYDIIETEVEDVHNDVSLRTRPLRNVILTPASSGSVEEALAATAVDYLYESDLREMQYDAQKNPDGVLDKDEIDAALDMVPTGTTELPTSPQPTGLYTSGDQVSTGGGQGSQTTKFFKNRGPIEVYRIHTRQYDLDKDGTPEENVIWVHRATRRMLGWMRYQYFNGRRPFFEFQPFRRPGSCNGFSLVERLAGLQNETNAQRRNRLDEAGVRLSPPFTVRKGSAGEDWDGSWGMNTRIPVDETGPQGDITRIQLDPLPQYSYMEEQMIKNDAGEYTGLQGAANGGQSSSRRSATEARQKQAAAMTRTGLIAMRFRLAIRPVINFVHDLKKQYLSTDENFVEGQQQHLLPLPVLSTPGLSIDVAGASDPIDAAARRTETLGASEIFMKFPAIAQDPVKQYYLLRKIAETFNWADVEQIIGTDAEAQQMKQAMLQAAQAQAQQGQAPQGQTPKQ